MKIFLVIPVLFVYLATTKGQSTSENSTDFPALQPDWSYCFEFTWFGPDYDNVTRYNGTCSDYLDDTRADGIPCAAPIVITYDGTPPDIDYLWDNYKSSILCKRSRNQVCVKYTYYFNNQVNNVTHMCSKVQSVNSNSALTSGCYKQTVNGYDIEACVCRSGPGIYKPCNAATSHISSLTLIFFYTILYTFRHFIRIIL